MMRQGELLGYITVSVVFRPCDSIAWAELPSMATVTVADGSRDGEDLTLCRGKERQAGGLGRGEGGREEW